MAVIPETKPYFLNGNNIGIYIKVDSVLKKLGLVRNVSWNENYNVQPVHVLSVWGPAALQSLGYSLTGSIGMFIPISTNGAKPDSSDITAHDIEWTRALAQKSGQGRVFDEVVLQREHSEGVTVLEKFYKFIITGQSGSVSSGQQIVRDIQFQAISRENPNSEKMEKKV